MKKKLKFCFALGCLCATVISGCGTKNTASSNDAATAQVPEETAAQDSQDQKDTIQAQPAEGQEAAAPVNTQTDASELTPEDAALAKHPVLGQADSEGSDEFQYLSRVLLYYDDTPDSVPVYVPDTEVDNDDCYGFSYGSSYGITYMVELNPIIQFDQEDYSLSENLTYYLEELELTDVIDCKIGEVKSLDETTAYGTAEYLTDYEYDGQTFYCAFFSTYLLKELDEDTTILVSMEVDAYEVTDETDAVIDELESYYQFEMNWDAEKATAKIAALSK